MILITWRRIARQIKPSAIFVRGMSLALEPKRTVISSHLTLWEKDAKQDQSIKTKPLVLLYPWLNSKPRAVRKFCDLYLNIWGYDVLIIQSSPVDFLWPASGRALARNTLDYIVAQHSSRPLLVHGLSIGAYIYILCLMEMSKNFNKYKNIKNHIHGQVFDSVVIGGLPQMISGVAKGVTKNAVGASLIKGTMSTYYNLTHKHTVQFYDEAVLFTQKRTLNVPTQIFYSIDDPMSDPAAMTELIDIWESRGLDLTVKCWEKSEHCGHMRNHPEEYVDCLKKFMSKFEAQQFKRMSQL